MILQSPPLRPVKFPPVHYAAKIHVRTGFSWVKYSEMLGRKDPWELIEFNFRTRNPREVNWYLENYVGCTKSNDGKNYSFDDSDYPGFIYLPDSDWTASEDLRLRNMVAFTLIDPVASRIDFTRHGHRINGPLLRRVASHIVNGDLRVVVDPALGPGEAEYVSVDENAFHLGFATASTVTRKGLIVHEAVHAALDMVGAKDMIIMQSEALAYAAQAFYVYENTRNPGPDNRLHADGADDEVYRIAWMIAELLSEKKSIDPVLWYALDNAVTKHRKYRKSWRKKAVFDGI